MVFDAGLLRVCRELIAEVVELFDSPRFFHLGYDEETAEHQAQYAYAWCGSMNLVARLRVFCEDSDGPEGAAVDLVGLRMETCRRVLYADAKECGAEQLYYGLNFNPERTGKRRPTWNWSAMATTRFRPRRTGPRRKISAVPWSSRASTLRRSGCSVFCRRRGSRHSKPARAHHEAAIRLVAKVIAARRRREQCQSLG